MGTVSTRSRILGGVTLFAVGALGYLVLFSMGAGRGTITGIGTKATPLTELPVFLDPRPLPQAKGWQALPPTASVEPPPARSEAPAEGRVAIQPAGSPPPQPQREAVVQPAPPARKTEGNGVARPKSQEPAETPKIPGVAAAPEKRATSATTATPTARNGATAATEVNEDTAHAAALEVARKKAEEERRVHCRDGRSTSAAIQC